ncbi:NAD(P)H-binding protein [Rugosimonospora acidiphila]|uniref:NAD(P)H-binding protein n=1 Tax=Rugosimonospora acidiphila TaxID=556531 RepID=A0ABP9SF12_9ACTN
MVAVVFGARGGVGRHVVTGLLAAGVRVRATSRFPDPAGLPAGTPVVAADLERPETLPDALRGAETAFIYARPLGIEGFVAAAESAGVRHVVLLSSGAVVHPGSQDSPIARQHRAVEVALERSGLAWTFLRGGMFASNVGWWWRDSIRARVAVRLPYPDAQTAPVHERDLAALAVAALTGPGHARRAYTVHGPESLTLRRQVEHLGDAIGREVRVEVVSPDEARASLGRIVPPAAVDATLGLWEAGTRAPAEVSTVVEEITGRPGYDFAQWARDHAEDFR